MRNKAIKMLTGVAVLATMTGCYRVTHDLDVMASPGVVESSGKSLGSFRREVKSSHLVWGLVNPNDKLVRTTVAEEVKRLGGRRAIHVRLTREISLVDGLVGGVTFGLYAPWSLIVEGEVVR